MKLKMKTRINEPNILMLEDCDLDFKTNSLLRNINEQQNEYLITVDRNIQNLVSTNTQPAPKHPIY